MTAIEILGPAARDATATAKTRQNLALSLALAGRWAEAGKVAAMDVSPDQLQARMVEWAQFARPANAYDQVASLLGVRAVEDGGQPVALALTQQPGVAVAAAAPAADPVDSYMPGVPQGAEQVAAVEAAAAPQVEAQPEQQQVAGTGPQIVFGPRAEVVQQVPVAQAAPARVAPKAPVRVAKAAAVEAPAVTAKAKPGAYYVQLGAYESAAVARDAWARHTRRVPSLRAETPQGVKFSTAAGNFYRLSVGGFARTDAANLCQQVRASGSPCFVRAAAGDSVAAWVKGGGRTQVAAR